MAIKNYKDEFFNYLQGLPSVWRKQVSDAIFNFLNEFETVECKDIQDCFSSTSLTNFTVEEGTACFTFTDKDDVEVTRCFSILDVLNNVMNDIEPLCLATDNEWQTMTWTQKWQRIIETVCGFSCEDPVTTTTTTTTSTTTTTTQVPTTTTSTTTTTTAAPTTTTSTTTTTTAAPTTTTSTTTTTTEAPNINWTIVNTQSQMGLPLTVMIGNNGNSPSSFLYSGTYHTDPLTGTNATHLPAVNANITLSVGSGKKLVTVTINGVEQPGVDGTSSFESFSGITGAPLVISFVTD